MLQKHKKQWRLNQFLTQLCLVRFPTSIMFYSSSDMFCVLLQHFSFLKLQCIWALRVTMEMSFWVFFPVYLVKPEAHLSLIKTIKTCKKNPNKRLGPTIRSLCAVRRCLCLLPLVWFVSQIVRNESSLFPVASPSSGCVGGCSAV